MILGKALGGGFFPISAVAGRKDIMDVFTPGSHGSTFGGNPLAAAIGLKALELLEEERLCERSSQYGAYFLRKLQGLHSPAIVNLRGKGLWIGMEIDPKKASARWICEKLANLGVLCKETHESVVRFAPPLIITQEEIDWALHRIQQVFSSL